MNRGDRKKCLEAGGDTLPPDHKATIFLLEPGKGSLRLEPWHHILDRRGFSRLGEKQSGNNRCICYTVWHSRCSNEGPRNMALI